MIKAKFTEITVYISLTHLPTQLRVIWKRATKMWLDVS